MMTDSFFPPGDNKALRKNSSGYQGKNAPILRDTAGH